MSQNLKNAITCIQYEFFSDHKKRLIYPIYKRLYASVKILSLKPQHRFNFFHAWILKRFIWIKVKVELRKVFEFTSMIHPLHNASNTLEIIDILMDWHWIHFKCSFGLTLAAMSEKVRRTMIMERLYRAAKVTTPYNRTKIFTIKTWIRIGPEIERRTKH